MFTLVSNSNEIPKDMGRPFVFAHTPVEHRRPHTEQNGALATLGALASREQQRLPICMREQCNMHRTRAPEIEKIQKQTEPKARGGLTQNPTAVCPTALAATRKCWGDKELTLY